MTKRRQHWISAPTKKAAEAEVRAFLTRLDTGGDPFPTEITLRAFAERWLAHMAGGVRARTLEAYEQLLRDHLLPALGDLRLDRLRPAHVQHALEQVAAAGCGPRTVVKARAVLGGAMRQAMARGLTPAKPGAGGPSAQAGAGTPRGADL